MNTKNERLVVLIVGVAMFAACVFSCLIISHGCSQGEPKQTFSDIVADDETCPLQLLTTEKQRDVAIRRIEEIKEECRKHWGDPEAMAIERLANAPLDSR